MGAFPVHGACGILGTLCVGIFGLESLGAPMDGLLISGDFTQLGIQVLGVVACLGFTAISMWVVFSAIKATLGLRVSRETEIKGLDEEEHGMDSYNGFQIFTAE